MMRSILIVVEKQSKRTRKIKTDRCIILIIIFIYNVNCFKATRAPSYGTYQNICPNVYFEVILNTHTYADVFCPSDRLFTKIYRDAKMFKNKTHWLVFE